MKSPEQWIKERDFRGGEYDGANPARLLALIAEVQADAIAKPAINSEQDNKPNS